MALRCLWHEAEKEGNFLKKPMRKSHLKFSNNINVLSHEDLKKLHMLLMKSH